jgi:hypothetical protein
MGILGRGWRSALFFYNLTVVDELDVSCRFGENNLCSIQILI